MASQGPGRLKLFAIDSSSGALHHRYFEKGAWQSGWENLEGQLFSAVSAVTSSFFGIDRIDVFALGGGNALYHKAWTGTAWTSWTSHGTSFSSKPAVTSWCSNRLDVLALGLGDKSMYRQAWNGSDWMPSIKGWEHVGGTFKVFP